MEKPMVLDFKLWDDSGMSSVDFQWKIRNATKLFVCPSYFTFHSFLTQAVKESFLSKKAREVRNGDFLLILPTCCTIILHFRNWSWKVLSGTQLLRESLAKARPARFPTLKELSPNWILTALSFRTSELNVGCHLLAAEVFRRKELGRYERGNQVTTWALVVHQKGFGHFSRLPWNFSGWQLNQDIFRPV